MKNYKIYKKEKKKKWYKKNQFQAFQLKMKTQGLLLLKEKIMERTKGFKVS